jgi:hypothetical protein
MTTRRRLATGVVCFLAVLGVASGGGAASAGNATLTDPSGDSSGAPDITAVALSDVPGTGTITVSVTASGLVASTSVDVWLDTDKNSSTGSLCGCEYALEIWQEADDWGWTMEKWSGTAWTMTPDSPVQRFSRSGDVFTWTFSKSDVGGAAGFAFQVGSYLADESGNIRSADWAPDGGLWAYDLSSQQAQTVKAVVGKPLVVPAKPSAGKLLSLAFPVTRSDNGETLSGATISATTKIGTASIPHTQSLNGGTAAVNVFVPKKAKGKLLTVTVRISLNGQTTTKVVSFRIA